MTSWKPWLPCIHSTVSARRSSPGSRARRARVSRAKRFSACSSSSRSALVNFSAATAVTRLSSSARTRNASHISLRESVRTRKPRFASNETRPSAERRRSASRTGVRLTAYCDETCSWRRTVPGSSSPETIASSSASAISSAFVPSTRESLRGVVKALVCGQRQELDERASERDLGEELLRGLARLDGRDLLPHALGREAARLDPCPDLRARDLRSGGVLHQVVDRRRADAVQPRVEVTHADRDVHVKAGVGHYAAGHREVDELPRGDLHLLT